MNNGRMDMIMNDHGEYKNSHTSDTSDNLTLATLEKMRKCHCSQYVIIVHRSCSMAKVKFPRGSIDQAMLFRMVTIKHQALGDHFYGCEILATSRIFLFLVCILFKILI